jgi:hypothetical protein
VRFRSGDVENPSDRGVCKWRSVRAVSGGLPEAAHNARMPTPQLAHHDDAVEGEEENPRRVAGTVRLMTEDPFEIDDAANGIGGRLRSIAAKSPWIIPAALVGLGVAFLVLRRRR